jgi:iron(III) transport system permease protein
MRRGALRRIFPESWSLSIFSAATVLAFLIVALLPVGVVLVQSFWIDGRFSLAAYSTVLAESRQWGLFWNTAVIAIGTALAATVLGAAVGCAIERLRVPGARGLTWALAIPLLMPPYVSAIVWVDVLARRGLLRFGLDASQAIAQPGAALYTVAGVILVLTLSYFPIPAFATLTAFRRYNASVEEPAQLVARSWTVFLRITLPLLAPILLGGSVLVFVLCLVEFGVPSLLQVNVYAVEIYGRFSTSYKSAEATAQALPLVACGALAIVGWLWYAKRRVPGFGFRASGNGQSDSPRITGRGFSCVCAALACWAIVLLAGVVPVAVMVVRSLPLSSYAEVWRTAGEEIGTSLLLAACSATALTLLALGTAYLARLRRPTARLFHLSVLPFLISGPVLGIGLIGAWNRPGPLSAVYDSVAILVLACTARFLFFGHHAMTAALRAVPARLDEAAEIAGASWGRRFLHVLLPLTAPALVAVWGLSFVLALRELDAAVLVAPPGWNPLSVRLFSLMHYGPGRLVAALCVITVLLILAGAAGTLFLHKMAKRLFHVHA